MTAAPVAFAVTVVLRSPGLECGEVIYLDDSGQQRQESARLAASTLIWQRGATTYRLEADLPPDQLTAIAASLPS